MSAVSAAEIGHKAAIGELRTPHDLKGRLRRHRFTPLQITFEHGLRVGRPAHHHRPSDRILVAQAQLEGLTIVTRDPRIARCGVATLAA